MHGLSCMVCLCHIIWHSSPASLPCGYFSFRRGHQYFCRASKRAQASEWFCPGYPWLIVTFKPGSRFNLVAAANSYGFCFALLCSVHACPGRGHMWILSWCKQASQPSCWSKQANGVDTLLMVDTFVVHGSSSYSSPVWLHE